jgi:hypothetical protein
VATENNTQVKIDPSADTYGGIPAHQSIAFVLNAGEVYQVKSKDLLLTSGTNDLTGSHITSNHPVAVFAGTYVSGIPNPNYNSNHLYEEMPPVQRWGKKFLISPLATILLLLQNFSLQAKYDSLHWQ